MEGTIKLNGLFRNCTDEKWHVYRLIAIQNIYLDANNLRGCWKEWLNETKNDKIQTNI